MIFVLLIIDSVLVIICTRNQVAFNNRQIIIKAIYDYYAEDFKRYNPDSCFYDMLEPYYKTMFRIWDFGHKRIVPPEVYDLIKNYI